MKKFALTAVFLLLATGHAYALGDDGDGGSNKGDVSNGSVGKSGKGGGRPGGVYGPLYDAGRHFGIVDDGDSGKKGSGGVGDKTGHSAQMDDKAHK